MKRYENVTLDVIGLMYSGALKFDPSRLYTTGSIATFQLIKFCREKNFIEVVKNYECIYNCLSDLLITKMKGNFFRVFQKKYFEDIYFSQFDPVKHYSLETIYMDLPRHTDMYSDECISTKMFKRCGVDVKNNNIPLTNSSLISIITSGSLLKNTEISENSDFGEMTPNAEENSEVILRNYQKKIIPDKSLFPGFDEKRSDARRTIEKDGLVVVASLIDRIPNLGGLARTCEIFGVSEYVVNSLKYIEDKQFTSLSVTAEKWINVKEVKAINLINYIFEMKLDGYTIIGAEQTLHSVPLDSAKFPKKSLLLLGNEKEGIPPNLLPLLDICVEIPQLGIIRSLNVHVTGALFIWEYAKQNNFV